ncbi:MAG: glutamate racemase [bacterium]
MKIGVFDSGLGGLIIFKELIKKFPLHDFVYLGDVKRLPYGSRSDETIFEYTKQAVEYLFEKRNCKLIILACNTASARALRRIQQELLPIRYPDRRVLGVIIPTVEDIVVLSPSVVGVLATSATVRSGVYKTELNKLNKKIKVFEKSAPSLVTLIENDEINFIEPILKNYLSFFLNKKIDTLVLGCTHYPVLKKQIKKIIGNKIKIISQEEIIPRKLKDYLLRHQEIEKEITKNGDRQVLVTEITDAFGKLSKKWLKNNTILEKVVLE